MKWYALMREHSDDLARLIVSLVLPSLAGLGSEWRY